MKSIKYHHLDFLVLLKQTLQELRRLKGYKSARDMLTCEKSNEIIKVLWLNKPKFAVLFVSGLLIIIFQLSCNAFECELLFTCVWLGIQKIEKSKCVCV